MTLNNELTPVLCSLERSVREGVEFLRTSPFVKKELKLHGYVIDVVTGKLQTVVE